MIAQADSATTYGLQTIKGDSCEPFIITIVVDNYGKCKDKDS